MNELLIKEIDQFIKENYIEVNMDSFVCSISEVLSVKSKPQHRIKKDKPKKSQTIKGDAKKLVYEQEVSCDLINIDDIKKINLDESFSQMVLRKIDEKKMSDVECYTKACLDRRLFSKLRSDNNYRPSKQTALLLAIALELPLEQFEDMLKKAGYALSNSSMSDVIVKYFINNNNYDLSLIDEVLLHYDQKTLINY